MDKILTKVYDNIKYQRKSGQPFTLIEFIDLLRVICNSKKN